MFGFKFLVFGSGPQEIFWFSQSIQVKELQQTLVISEMKKNGFLISVNSAVKKII